MPNDDLSFLNDNEPEEIALDETSDFNMVPTTTEADDSPVEVAQTVIPYDDRTISLGKDNFAALMSVFQMLKHSAPNLFIKNGKVTQLNDKRSLIFDVDLTPILADANILISSLPSKYDALIIYKKQNVEVFLDIDPRGYVFRDSRSKLHFARLVESVLGNSPYVTEQQVIERADINPDRRIFSYVWKKADLDRIIHWIKLLGTNVINFEFNGDSIDCVLQSLDNASTTKATVLTLEDEVDDNSLTNKTMCFLAQSLINFIQGGVVEVQSEMFMRRDTTRTAATIKFSALIPIAGTNQNVSVVTYAGGYVEEVRNEVHIG